MVESDQGNGSEDANTILFAAPDLNTYPCLKFKSNFYQETVWIIQKDNILFPPPSLNFTKIPFHLFKRKREEKIINFPLSTGPAELLSFGKQD